MYECTCVYTCIRLCACECVCVCLSVCVCNCKYIHVNVFVCMYVYRCKGSYQLCYNSVTSNSLSTDKDMIMNILHLRTIHTHSHVHVYLS